LNGPPNPFSRLLINCGAPCRFTADVRRLQLAPPDVG
jgi:hypothetical protein